MSINKRLRQIASPPPMSVHFPRKFPKVSLYCRAPLTAKPRVVVSRVPRGPDPPLLDRILHIGFPFGPDIGVGANQLFLDDDVEENCDEQEVPFIEEEVPFNGVILNWNRENNRTSSVAGARILVLSLSLLTTFSVEDVVGFLKPHLIGFARSAAGFLWQQVKQWGPSALAAASSYAPLRTRPVMSFICRLPPRYIALLPPLFIALLPPSIIETLPRSCIETLPPSCIETLSHSCIETLSPSCIETLSPSFIARLPRSCIDSLSLHPGTHMEVQLIILQRMVDEISLRVAVLVPWVPVPFVVYAVRFGISFGFWSLSLAIWRLLHKLEFP